MNLADDEKYPIIYYKRAFACQSIGRYAEAILDYTMFIQCCEEAAHQGHLGRGLVYTELKEFEKALEDIQLANGLNSQQTTYYQYCLARAYHNCGQNDESKKQFAELRKIEIPKNARKDALFEIHFYRGLASYELNEYSYAQDEFHRSKNYKSNDKQEAEIDFYIALILYASGDVEGAKKALGRVIELDSNHERAHFQLAMMLSQDDGSNQEALNSFTTAHKKAPHKFDILYERAELHYRMGHLETCISDKRKAIMAENASDNATLTSSYFEVGESYFY